jgi:molybdopterin synthase catalytic subunit
MPSPAHGDDWVALSAEPLVADEALRWTVRPDCGAQVLFTGTVRDHAEGRSGVSHLEYEAYPEPAVDRMMRIAEEARLRWTSLGRIALLHRVGRLEVGECAVVVAVSAPHRDEAFEAGRWCIDTLKATVPIWKRESWSGGVGWGTDAQEIRTVTESEGRDRDHPARGVRS